MIITFETMYPLTTQLISSSVAPRWPITCGSATFTIVVSSTSSTVASIRAASVIQVPRSMRSSGRVASVVDTDAGLGRESDRQPKGAGSLLGRARRLAPLELDRHRHALHDLGEVARGIVGREQRVLRSGRRRERRH